MNYIIILNWNGWKDTIECLESVFQLKGNYRVVVCDNDSQDDSMQHLRHWAEGNPDPSSPRPSVSNSIEGLAHRPISFTELQNKNLSEKSSAEPADFTLIQTGANLGFAGGNNVGLRWAMCQNDFERAWLLNNDTVVDADALIALAQRMKDDDQIGICGSTVIYYHSREKVQAFGGARYFPCIGMSMHIGRFFSRFRRLESAKIEPSLDYIMGASMMVSRSFLENVGLMDEDFFLYCEELDWALRARNKYTLGYAPDSLVYHKSGASIGSGRMFSKRSNLAEYYLTKNRMVIIKRYFSHFYWLVFTINLLSIGFKFLSGNRETARIGFRAIRNLPYKGA